jgi:aspartyl-tRNA(Asn)/glutamyl-tRNA(Gln) amidotransferase subunit A
MYEMDLANMSLVELSSLIQKKETSATEVVKIYLDRIERLQSKLNAYITVCREEALISAKEIDDSLTRSNQTRKPLLGIPIALKDQFDTRGLLTTNGSLALKDHIPDEDASVVAKLKESGAILLGKLNMAEFAAAGGEDPPFGQPRNPWNVLYSPGGSSSGSGIAVSSGLCAASIGEDTGGSGRGPASFCGVVGLRPSAGLVSRFGIHSLSPSFDTASPLGRTVADCATLLQVIAGYDPKDQLSSRRPVADYLSTLREEIKGVRIGVIREFMDDQGLDREIRTITTTAINKLTDLGVSIDEVSIPYIGNSMYALGIIIWCEGAALNRKWVESKYQLIRQSTRVGFLAGCLLPVKAYLIARQAQALIRTQILEAFQKYDLLLCPTSPKLAPKIEDAKEVASFPEKEDVVRRHAEGHSGFAPLAGCPAISVPCGFSKMGLPIGLQITGRPFEDALVLRLAHAYEQITEWHNQHPSL